MSLDTQRQTHLLRRADVEAFRVIAAAMIVWYHAGVGAQEVAYGGLIVFLIISTYLAAQSRNRSPAASLQAKVERLIVPWLFWMAVYGVVNLLFGKPWAPGAGDGLEKLLAGTAPHLWYMPFIFFALLLIDVVKRSVRPPAIGVFSGVSAAVILMTAGLWRDYSIALGSPLAQYCHAMAGVLIGLFFGYRDQIQKYIFLGLLILLIGSAIFALPWRGVGVTYLVGIVFGCVLSFEWLRGFNFGALERLSPYTLGIYFIHILVLWGVDKLRLMNAVDFVLTFLISALVVVGMLRRYPKFGRYWA